MRDFCSKECAVKTVVRTTCQYCGSSELYDHGKSYKKKLCRPCFDVWQKERQEKYKYAYRPYWRPVTCKKCGVIKELTYRAKEGWLCVDCRSLERHGHHSQITIVKICRWCGRNFLADHDGRVYCSRECQQHKTPGGKCIDCGDLLEGNKTHKSSAQTCDICQAIRRNRYKDKAKYGEYWELAQTARRLSVVSYMAILKTEGSTAWQKEKVEKMERLLRKRTWG